ncbi:MAG: 50S ribosomal protein L21, partial [Phycisphaerales bacterium]|nr:50S ribosomal protein L21 [Phycisphaerales bacterium]
MYAIIEDSGTQIKVSEGDEIKIDLREVADDASTVTFDRVLMVGDGDSAKFGAPYVDGSSVTAEILDREWKDKKIDVIKFKRRKGYRRKQGHRQR